MDALCLAAIVQELQAILPGAEINRIQQLDRWSLLLVFYGGQGPGGLVLSVMPGAPRVELCRPPRKPAVHVSRFGDLIASKTKGAVIEGIEQVGLDRIVAIHLRGGPLSDAAMTLYLEMLGAAGNMVLVDRATGTVTDRLRAASGRTGGATSGPGEPYRPPSMIGASIPGASGKSSSTRWSADASLTGWTRRAHCRPALPGSARDGEGTGGPRRFLDPRPPR
ncbi:MAG: NFACT family protein [Candidatus Methylomirabilis sp.]|nr:NFACT family protein [Candidatus Methylomirabilis sp.]